MQRSNRNGLIVTLPAGTQVDGIVPANVKRQKPKVEAPPLETDEARAAREAAEQEAREAAEQEAKEQAAREARAAREAAEQEAREAAEQAAREEAESQPQVLTGGPSQPMTNDSAPPTPDDDGEFA